MDMGLQVARRHAEIAALDDDPQKYLVLSDLQGERTDVGKLRGVSIGSPPATTARVRFAFAAGERLCDLSFLLSVIAGSVDIIGFLCLDGLFPAHITGNLAVLAARIIAGDPAILSHILSVPTFASVLLSSSLMARVFERAGRSSLKPLLLLQLLFLLTCLLLSVTAGPWRDASATLAVVAGMFAVAAMATQNALVRIALRNTPATAVMTTNVTHLMVDVGTVLVRRCAADITEAKARALQLFPVIVGFMLGCALGAVAEAAVGVWALVLPTALASFAVNRDPAPRPTRLSR
jgi:uncharacterized membrane protein YoaK (UPF0700 family)